MIGSYDFKAIEKEILEHWRTNDIYKGIKNRNIRNKKWTYLDGPPYTSGRIHLGTAWGKSLRDMAMRYRRMQGFDVWDRAGFDMHGLPTENKVAAKFNFTTKDQIIEFGIEKFQKECESFCVENMKIMSEDFKRLGVWMDFDDPYMPIKPEYMEGEWFLTKKAHEKGRLYKGAKVMTWCASCETSLSKHELEYQNVSDKSIFVKLKVEGKESEFLIIWTTTPWTIPFNLAVMVNPTLEYVRIKVDSETWIVSKGLVGIFMGSVVGKKYELVEEFLGESLDGLRYHPVFFNESKVYQKYKEGYKRAFTVLLSEEYVDLSAGTGLVHCAPGCGPEDYEVGKSYGLPAFNETNEHGVFSDEMGRFSGLSAKKDDHVFIEHLKNSGSLIASTQVDHDYAHCWRCHKPVIYRATEQWFFKVEDLKDKMVAFNKEIRWVPDAAFNAFESWLLNLKDNGITRQRFWGTPVPIWECTGKDCKEIEIIGSIDELKAKAGKLPENFHIPWIDELSWKCTSCGAQMRRVPDIFDVWIDAGCAGFLCYDFPKEEVKFNRYYPADLILEGKDQIRGWFNLLMVASTLALDSPSFKAVYMHGFINDYRGIKMSKSLGNVTDPNEIIDSFGADTLRYYTIGAANPGMDMNYNPEDPKIRLKNLLILWNLHKYLADIIQQTGTDIKDIDPKSLTLSLEDKYILSKLFSMIKEATSALDQNHLSEIPDIIEGFYLELSRTYVQAIRDKLVFGTDEEKDAVVKVIGFCIREFIKVAAPVIPFITDKIYLNLKEHFQTKEMSVHEFRWPSCDEGMIDKELEADFESAGKIIQAVLHAREKAQLGVRWPVSEVIVETENNDIIHAVKSLSDMIKQQVNAKELKAVDKFDRSELSFKADYKALGPLCGKDTPEVISHIARMDPRAVEKALLKEGFLEITLGNNSYDVMPDHLIKETSIPEGFQSEGIKGGIVYLNKEMDETLEMEGLAREIMRRIQNARKTLGLQKSDSINLYLSSSDEGLIKATKEWESQIKEKVGAASLKYEKPKDGNLFKEKIKGKEFEFSILQMNL